MPQISVIVPAYKVEPYLRRCIDSILAQTFTDFELILIDDGSPDNCGVICDEYAAKDSRIHVIHQENGGLSAARNAGIDWAFAHSDSEWLTFIDSDDWVHPEFLKCLYDAAKEHSLQISMCSLKETEKYEIDENTGKYRSIVVTPREAYIFNTDKIVAYACGRLYYKAGCFSSVRFPVGRLWEDLATVYKLLWGQEHIALVPEALYYYYKNDSGIVYSEWTPKKLDELTGYEEQIPFFRKIREEEIYYRLVSTYLSYIMRHYKRVKESTLSEQAKVRYICSLRKKVKLALRVYAKELKITIANRPEVYEFAYPKEMQVYWLMKACIHRFMRK